MGEVPSPLPHIHDSDTHNVESDRVSSQSYRSMKKDWLKKRRRPFLDVKSVLE